MKTLDLDDAARRSWDVLVVGAGPAGALSARAAARAGLRVLLVDKAAFPRGKVCGSCLNGRALAALDACGLGGLPRQLGALPLENACLATGGRQARLALPAGLALSRQVFDAALVQAAIDQGAHFSPETTAAAGSVEELQRTLVLRHRQQTSEVAARIVVAADGLGGRLQGAGGRLRRADSRIGVGSVLPGQAGYTPGCVHLACGRGGYVGVVCVEADRLDVAAALDAHWLRDMGSAAAAARSLLEQAGLPCPKNLDEADWRGTQPLTQRAARLAEHRLFVVGDAAGYVEPFTGEGIAWALEGALALAPLVQQGVEEWQPALTQRWAARHRRLVGRRQRTCQLLAWLLRRPALTRALLGTLARWPGLAAPVVQRLNGRARQSTRNA